MKKIKRGASGKTMTTDMSIIFHNSNIFTAQNTHIDCSMECQVAGVYYLQLHVLVGKRYGCNFIL